MIIAGHDIGVCSWSLRPKTTAELIQYLQTLGLRHLQIALRPLVELNDADRAASLNLIRRSGVVITAGMIDFVGEDYSTIAAIHKSGGYAPDALWNERRGLSIRCADLGKEMGLTAITTHIGFIPPSHDAGYKTMMDRVREITAIFGERGISLGLETGQERAQELLHFLEELNVQNIFVNFDPANMIAYGAGDPIEAIGILAKHIRHVHAKDAVYSVRPTLEWGEEVPFGAGSVGPELFLDALESIGYTGPIAIEREAGESRLADVQFAIQTLREAAPGEKLPN